MNKMIGDVELSNGHYALVAGKFNQSITDLLVQGSVEALVANGIKDEHIDCFWVPGAFEIPLITKKIAETKKYKAIITLGAVIRGETAHFDYVCSECARGVANLTLQYDMPIMFGVLTTDTDEQAMYRAQIQAGNKGGDVAIAALEMVSLMKKI